MPWQELPSSEDGGTAVAAGVLTKILQSAQINLDWAGALLTGLAASGVHHAVISPGSRSTPLVMACDRHPGIRTWILPDERCAAFFALGITRAGRGPAALIGTSGSASANWYPAVIEASRDYQPLILISADRPAELQACGANQTVDQTRLFGTHVRAFFELPEADASADALRHLRERAVRLVDQSRWPLPGPVHVNVPLREPLVAESVAELEPAPVSSVCLSRLKPDAADLADLATRLSGGRGLIVCGRADNPPRFAEAVVALAAAMQCPLLADPLSGLRFGAHDPSLILTRYDAFLRRGGFARPDWVLHFGAMPTSKSLQKFMAQASPGGSVRVVPHGEWPDPAHVAGTVLHADPMLVCGELAAAGIASVPGDWTAAFLDGERYAAAALRESANRPLEAEVMAILSDSCPDGASVFCGNSMVIRDVDGFLAGGDQSVRLYGNRGASGIDGNVSTALGIAAAADQPLIGLLGDLALYHDMNGLLAARGLDATLIVFSNGGGGIFRYLPQAGLEGFERYWLTPTGLDPAKIADLYGLGYHRVLDPAGFEAALLQSLQAPGVDLIDVIIDPDDSVARHRAYWEAVGG